MTEPHDAVAISGYHAHIYYDPAATRDRAERIRAWIAERFPAAQLGRWHDAPVGPHPRAMFQIAFSIALFPGLVPSLMLNRLGLTVLCGRPERGNGFRRGSMRQSARPGIERQRQGCARLRACGALPAPQPRSALVKGPASCALTWDISCQAAMVSSSGNLRQCSNGVQV